METKVFHHLDRGVILLAMMLNFLLSPTAALTPLVVTDVFQKGALELGWIQALFGIGIIAGGVLLGVWGGPKKKIFATLSGVIGVCLGVILFGLAPVQLFYWLLLASFMQGFSAVFANGPF